MTASASLLSFSVLHTKRREEKKRLCKNAATLATATHTHTQTHTQTHTHGWHKFTLATFILGVAHYSELEHHVFVVAGLLEQPAHEPLLEVRGLGARYGDHHRGWAADEDEAVGGGGGHGLGEDLGVDVAA